MSQISEFEQLCKAQNTAQISISQGGKIVFDRTFVEDPIDVFAVQKGIISILIAIAETRYFLERYDAMNHILTPEWTQLSKPDEASLTVEILMNMTTGMDESLKAKGTMGKDWAYNNVAYQKLKEALEIQTGMTLQAITEQWLLAPLGLSGMTWRTRAADGEVVLSLRFTQPHKHCAPSAMACCSKSWWNRAISINSNPPARVQIQHGICSGGRTGHSRTSYPVGTKLSSVPYCPQHQRT